ncbi:MAG: Xaa-Pro peptidase family protein [Fuerstiella sp.]
MLTLEGCSQRQQNLWSRLPSTIDWVLIADARHVQYFCGFRVNPLSFSADQKALLLLRRDGSSILLADNFTRRTCTCDVHATDEEIFPWYTHKQSVINRDEALLNALQERSNVFESGHGLIEREAVPDVIAASVSEHADFQFEGFVNPDDQKLTSLGAVIRDLRRQKLPDEVALLKRCMQAGDSGHAAAMKAIQPGMTELDLYLVIQNAAIRTAGQASCVYGDFRANNAARHKAGGLPTDYVLQEGDLFIADYSVIIDGYRSDFTNTMAVGQPSDAAVKQFQACEAALNAAAAGLKTGATGQAIYELASAQFLNRDYPPLSHHCGHGLGMEHPEPPILVPQSSDVLRTGDVVTIEPGLYIEGVGGMRFEHNYLITEGGSEQLSHHHIGLT